MNTASASLPASQRIGVLDIVRGFALMGILIMNMPGFSSSFFAEADGSHLWPGKADQLAEQIRDMLFSGKFNSMFSLLFGIGFTLQYTRLQQKDPQHATQIYLRRLVVLAIIGAVHACVFWAGDVLHVYAILGLLLVFPLRNAGRRTIVTLIVLTLLYPAVNGLLRLAIVTPEVTAMQVAQWKELDVAENAALGHGSFWDAAAQHTRVMLHAYGDRWSLWGNLGWYVQMAQTMLLGLLVGREGWVRRIPELMPQVKRLMWWALGIGLACGAAFTIIFEFNRVPGPSPIKFIGSLCYWTSRPAMMVFYVLLIVRLAQQPAWQRRFAPFAAAGRMPLTNYLMQTAICTTLFYGWGFGLWGQVGPALQLVLSLFIFFAVQVPWSLWWLRRHDQGPLEWAWSRLTYGRTGAAPAASAAT